jgi:hypothetical protein
MEKVIIDAFPDGSVTIKVEGAPGPTCTELTESVEKDLGKVTSRTATPEMFEEPQKETRTA